ncbi:hypothetical protein [Nostoc sp. FACHB-110]|uniref:hypothetical protein n=1 Tax=Nostoc sp. FACHB-110 TaxID=2692834 RepID=UPI001686CD56|nr:hypothetical protein [Nostoc sp. FACHB-110]MBD2441191.1 hypothetical protein [Nostoc sp. FACHB-110]
MQQNSFGCLGLMASFLIFQFLIQSILHPSQKLSTQSRVNYDSFGKIKIGMTVAQAEKAGNIKLLQLNGNPNKKEGCFYMEPESGTGLFQVRFMVVNGRITTFEIGSNPNIYTQVGVNTGTPENDLRFLYGFQNVLVLSDKALKKRYLIYFPPKAKNYRLIFESNGTYATRFKAGKLPEVTYPHGCASYLKI